LIFGVGNENGNVFDELKVEIAGGSGGGGIELDVVG
jgi:hypothetical protein